ncbi:multidrug resistance-associated protein 5 [Tanacetum coccineum]
MDFSEFYKELEAEFWGASAKRMGLQLLQLELRLGKIHSRSFRPVKSAKILCQFWASSSFGVSLAHDGSWSKFWHVIPAGGNLFEVRSGSEGFTGYEGKRTCSCRMWLLSGIPCVHATKVIFLINRVPESYVPAWFETDMYFVAYHNFMKPIPGMNFLPDQSMYSTVLPPKPRKIAGRPRKKRIRAIGEGGSSTRVSKVGLQGSFLNCRKHGYNKASCKEPVVEQTLKPKGVQGGASGSRGDASGFGGGASVSRGVASGSRGGTSGSGGASGSRGRDAGGSGGASGSRAPLVVSDPSSDVI